MTKARRLFKHGIISWVKLKMSENLSSLTLRHYFLSSPLAMFRAAAAACCVWYMIQSLCCSTTTTEDRQLINCNICIFGLVWSTPCVFSQFVKTRLLSPCACGQLEQNYKQPIICLNKHNRLFFRHIYLDWHTSLYGRKHGPCSWMYCGH